MIENGNRVAELFEESQEAAGEGERWRWGEIPAKCAVYLLAGAGGETLLLGTVGNLRAALQRRLGEEMAEGQTKRVVYSQICSRIYWRVVHSPFAANWWYWKIARQLFPGNYRELIGWQGTWWVGVEKDAAFPKLRRTQAPDDAAMKYAGPIRDKRAAGSLVETVEDLFDLCRYHHVLVQAPHGKACAYKEMGKCPGPCDGSVPMEWYREQIQEAFRFVADWGWRREWLGRQEGEMRELAARLEFEKAGRVKQRLVRAAMIEGEAYGHVGALEDFSFVALEPGKGKNRVEVWLIHRGRVICAGRIQKKELPGAAEGVFEMAARVFSEPLEGILGVEEMEQMSLVAHHLFRGADDAGVYLRWRDIAGGGSAGLAGMMEKFFERKRVEKPLPEQASDRKRVEEGEKEEEKVSPAEEGRAILEG